MSDPELERLTAEHLEGTLDEAGLRRLEERLEADPAARAAFADQVQVHHRLGRAYRDEGKAFATAVVRELEFQEDGPRFAATVVGRLSTGRSGTWLRILPLAAAAAVVIGVSALLVFEPDPVPDSVPTASRGRVLFVVGRLPLAEGDEAVLRRLEGLGFAVTPHPALTLRSGDAAGCAFVAVSSTARAEQLSATSMTGMGSLLRDLAVPLLVWEPRLFSDLGMVAGTAHTVDWAASFHPGRIEVVDAGHPLAAGLSGAVEVASARSRLSWGRTAPGIRRIAVVEGLPERAALFAVDSGDVLDGGRPAPARRAALFLFETGVPRLTAEGWRLFDAAALWCAGAN